MAAGPFTCRLCGAQFELPDATAARYPGWTPRLCARCRASEAGGRRTSGGGARAGSGATRTRQPRAGTQPGALLAPSEVLARYSEGPDTGVFTDGSCSGNPGPGGWGAVRVRAGEILDERYGHEPQTTNNRMELTAMIAGLEMLPPDEAVDVYSDSRLVVDTLTKWAPGWERRGWRRSGGEVANLELVQRAYALLRERPRARVQWIRAHDGSRWNEYADALATTYLRERS